MKKIPFYHEMIATGLGVGHFPYGPGTMGALLAILIWYPITTMANHTTWFIITLALIFVFTLLGAWSSTVAERYWGEDPSRVVIDEVVGQWITLLAVPAAFSWWHVLVAFILFRFFDIIKPLGVRKMENFNSGWGIMADDILAGCYGAILIYLLSIIEW